MAQKIIIFDIDGILAEFVFGATDLMCDLGILKVPYGTDQQPSWDFDISPKDQTRLWDAIRNSPTFWEDLNPLASSVEMALISQLNEEHIVYFVTSRQNSGNAKQQTERWLTKRGINNPTVIISANKGDVALAVGADYLVDDKCGNAIYAKYRSPKTEVFLIDRPYNRFTPENVVGTKVKRIKTVTEFLDAINGGSTCL